MNTTFKHKHSSKSSSWSFRREQFGFGMSVFKNSIS